ncbi:MAG: formate dehydrogenase accessory sulfurtransferase FdhD [Roseibacillus sp.]
MPSPEREDSEVRDRGDKEVGVVRAGQPGVEDIDRVALEEPLQLVVNGHAVAVLMRTPGDDEELAVGFLWTEGIISRGDQVLKVDLATKENHALVFLDDGVEVDLNRLTRHLFSASSCGLCGKASIDAITSLHEPVSDGPSFPESSLLEAPSVLRSAQATFEKTGGLHASGIFSKEGSLLALREDVGRHNALDKLLGWALLNGQDLSENFVLMSGRLSFELMQKALAGRLPLVAGISAPSSLAVEFSRESNQTLVGFLRAPHYNVYAGIERVVSGG